MQIRTKAQLEEIITEHRQMLADEQMHARIYRRGLGVELGSPRKVQQELHAVHFPHMLGAAVAVAGDVYLVRERLRKPFPRRKVQVPVDFLENIEFLVKNWIKIYLKLQRL